MAITLGAGSIRSALAGRPAPSAPMVPPSPPPPVLGLIGESPLILLIKPLSVFVLSSPGRLLTTLGVVTAQKLVTHRFPLDQVSAGFRPVAEAKESVKALSFIED